MAIALETVVKQLEDSGIVAQGKLENFIPPRAHPKSVEELVSELVKQNHLTKFQAQQVALGKSKALILSGYTILDKIGAGGMGQVFKAEHRRMKRIVAIKMLPPAMTKDAAATARFQREVEAAAKLEHPNIVTAHDADQANGAHFLVMQYVEGKDLSALVKKDGPFPVAKAVNYILQAARGLEFAHSEGVVHRDIKPANLLLDKKGVVKILDMGLARIDAGSNAPAQAELTGTGAVMGTVDYMAPEQAMSTRDADARADIYSLGCALHYLIAGKPTYGGESVIEKLLAHREKPIPNLRDFSADVTQELEAVFKKMVAKNTEDRYQTMTEVLADLEKCSYGQSNSLRVQQSTGTNLDNSALTFFQNLQATPRVQKSRATKQVTSVKSGEGKQPPWKNAKVLIVTGTAGFLFLLLGVWLIIRDKDGNEVAKVKLPDGGTATVQTTPAPKTRTPPAVVPKIETTASAPTMVVADFALDFDGQKDYVATPIWLVNAAVFTIEAWARPQKDSRERLTLLADEGNSGFELYRGPGGQWRFACAGEDDKTYSQSSTALAAGGWTHVAGVHDGRELRLYVDGMKQGSKACAKYKPSAENYRILIGGNPVHPTPDNPGGNGPSHLFQGQIDEVRISKVARYIDNFTPKHRFTPDDNTIALYYFDEGSGDIAQDSSRNGHHAKIVGGKWVKTDSLNSPQSTTPNTPSGPLPPLAIAPFDAKIARAHQDAWAKHLGTKVETTNSVGQTMNLIPPGEFLMGSTDEQVEAALKVAEESKADRGIKERIQKAERPQHKVVITKPFLLSTTEVTIGQFKKFVEATKYVTEAEQYGFGDSGDKMADEKVTDSQKQRNWRTPGYAVTGDSPVAQITWNDAVAYCKWLSEQEKTTYRLPTEAEWEYACRAGTTTQYSFGDDAALLDQYGWYKTNAGGQSHPVATKLPNGFGLFDMHGNLFEWCGDYFDEKWYEKFSPNDPNGPAVGFVRVLRGGPWYYHASACRSTYRFNQTPLLRNHYNGFRCLSELDIPVVATSTPAASSKLFFPDPTFRQWVNNVQAMPAQQQIEAVSKKLMELNPWFDGVVTGLDRKGVPKIENGVVTQIQFVTDNLTDISPIRALAGLKILHCGASQAGKSRLSDLMPLRGMPLTNLNFGSTIVDDLSPLEGMPLVSLACEFTQIADLSPLNNHKSLLGLNVRGSKVTPAAVAALQKALPNCKIEWDDPAKATTPPNASPVDPNRRAAEWILSKGGNVRLVIRKNQAVIDVNRVEEMPKDSFTIGNISLHNKSVLEDEFVNLAGCRINFMNLNGSKIGDRAVAHCTSLAHLG